LNQYEFNDLLRILLGGNIALSNIQSADRPNFVLGDMKRQKRAEREVNKLSIYNTFYLRLRANENLQNTSGIETSQFPTEIKGYS
jgi:hypothetical protein